MGSRTANGALEALPAVEGHGRTALGSMETAVASAEVAETGRRATRRRYRRRRWVWRPAEGAVLPWGQAGWSRGLWLFIYYIALIAVLAAMYGGGHYRPPPFIYQGF